MFIKQIYGYLLNLDSSFALWKSLFGAIKFTKNVNPDRYSHSRFGTEFDIPVTFSLSDGHGFGKHIILFRVCNNSLVHADNRKKEILILNKGPTNGLDDTKLTAESKYSINFTEQQQQQQKLILKSTLQWN